MIVSALLMALACSSSPDSTEPELSAAPAADKPAAVKPAAPPPQWRPATIGSFKPTAPAFRSTTKLPLAETSEITATIARLTEIVDRYAGDPDNPWAIGHGLLARGANFKLNNQQSAVDYLFSNYAESFDLDGTTLIRFPERKGETLVQPHSQLLLKALTESGVSPDRTVTVGGTERTVADLYRGAVMESYLVAATDHSSFASPNDVPWALQALAAWAPPRFAWQSPDGTTTDLNGLTDFVAAVALKETRFMVQARKQGTGFQKRGQGIFRYTCGGAHLIQGLNYAVARGFGQPTAQYVSRDQGPLLLYRFPIELAQIEQAIKDQKDFAFRLHIQRLKLTGHTLETLHKMSAMGQLELSAAEKTRLDAIALQVVESVRRLEMQKAFDRLSQIRAKDEQVYLDLVGDAAHALRGLQLAVGQQGINYR